MPDRWEVEPDEESPQVPTPRGQTTVNDGREPDRETIAQQDAQLAKRRLDGWIAEDKWALKVANGLVDDYFRKMKHALEDGASKPPKEAAPEGTLAQELLNNYRDQLARYGATGSVVPGTGARSVPDRNWSPPWAGSFSETPRGWRRARRSTSSSPRCARWWAITSAGS